MLYAYLVAGLAAVLLQVALLDSSVAGFMVAPLLVVLVGYIRRGYASAAIFGVVVMWFWDIHSYAFGLRAVSLLLTLLVLHLVKVLVLSQTNWVGIALLCAIGVVVFQGWLLLGSAIEFGWHYYAISWSSILSILVSAMIGGVICAISYSVAERFHTIVKR